MMKRDSDSEQIAHIKHAVTQGNTAPEHKHQTMKRPAAVHHIHTEKKEEKKNTVVAHQIKSMKHTHRKKHHRSVSSSPEARAQHEQVVHHTAPAHKPMHHAEHKKPRAQKKAYSQFHTDKDIAMDFATKVHRQFDHLIKATVLFGSQTTGEVKPGSDIDIIIIIDDAAINWDMELTSWYREELAKLIAAQNYAKDLHINTIRLTTWWRDLMHGDPVVLNIIRQGQVLIDIGGFFNPIKALMVQGKIHSTPEAVYAALQRSPHHLLRSKLAVLGAVEGVYWCMVEAAQAALITLGKLPPSPEHVTQMLHESFVETGILKSEFVKWYRDIYVLHKQIAHGEIRAVKADDIDTWQERAEAFMKKMVDIIDQLIEARKASLQKE